MAQQLAIDTGSGNPPPNPAQYPSNAPEYVGGQTNPTTGAITPASQATADVAPPPQLPTTKLAKVAPKSSSLPATAGGYLGTAIGGEIGGQVGGGASLGAAASSTLNNLGTTLNEPIAGVGSTAPGGSILGTSAGEGAAANIGGAVGAGLGAGVFTAGIGALEGEKPSVYASQGVGSAAGAFLGAFLIPILGPLGPVIGSIAGAEAAPAIESLGKDISSFFSHLF